MSPAASVHLGVGGGGNRVVQTLGWSFSGRWHIQGTDQGQITAGSSRHGRDFLPPSWSTPELLSIGLPAGSEEDGEALRRASSWKVPSERDGLQSVGTNNSQAEGHSWPQCGS